MEWLEKYKEQNLSRIKKEIIEREKWKQRKSNEKYHSAIHDLKDFKTDIYDFNNNAVKIGNKNLDSIKQKSLITLLETFKPWRKGPFEIYSLFIDTEWRSEKKWNRIVPYLPDLKEKKILDIGCNNGYYLFKLAANPVYHILGIDPTLHYYFTYQAIRTMINAPLPIDYELLGVEHVKYFHNAFDIILLMGILYHHPSPLEILKDVKNALVPGGTLIIETQGIQGKGPYALFPRKRYAKAPGTYFIPTKECLDNIIHRAGFRKTNHFYEHSMNSGEQRKTQWMDYESYSDFLSPEDRKKTVEGYPAPWRYYIQCIK